MKIITVKEFMKGIRNIDLKDILAVCGKRYEDRVWIAFNVDCLYSNWDEKFKNAPNMQLKMTYEEVKDYARNVGETTDGLFYALKKDIVYDDRKIQYKELNNFSDFIIEFFDSTDIFVTTDNELCIGRLKKKYKYSRIIKKK